MAAIRKAGGPRGRGSFRLTWRGGRVAQEIDSAIQAGMDEQAERIRGRLRTELHKLTGEMAERSFAFVEVRGGRRTLRAGSEADHTTYHELGTANYPAHPQIRQIMDEEIPYILPRIRSKLRPS